MIEVEIGKQNNSAEVTNRGELVVGPRFPSKFHTNTTTVANTPVNVIAPVTNKIFIITAIVLAGDRTIGANGAVVDVYESRISGTDTTIETQIYQDEIAKQTRTVLTNLYIETSVGRYINVQSSDVQVRANIAGFYVSAE